MLRMLGKKINLKADITIPNQLKVHRRHKRQNFIIHASSGISQKPIVFPTKMMNASLILIDKCYI